MVTLAASHSQGVDVDRWIGRLRQSVHALIPKMEDHGCQTLPIAVLGERGEETTAFIAMPLFKKWVDLMSPPCSLPAQTRHQLFFLATTPLPQKVSGPVMEMLKTCPDDFQSSTRDWTAFSEGIERLFQAVSWIDPSTEPDLLTAPTTFDIRRIRKARGAAEIERALAAMGETMETLFRAKIKTDPGMRLGIAALRRYFSDPAIPLWVRRAYAEIEYMTGENAVLVGELPTSIIPGYYYEDPSRGLARLARLTDETMKQYDLILTRQKDGRSRASFPEWWSLEAPAVDRSRSKFRSCTLSEYQALGGLLPTDEAPAGDLSGEAALVECLGFLEAAVFLPPLSLDDRERAKMTEWARRLAFQPEALDLRKAYAYKAGESLAHLIHPDVRDLVPRVLMQTQADPASRFREDALHVAQLAAQKHPIPLIIEDSLAGRRFWTLAASVEEVRAVTGDPGVYAVETLIRDNPNPKRDQEVRLAASLTRYRLEKAKKAISARARSPLPKGVPCEGDILRAGVANCKGLQIRHEPLKAFLEGVDRLPIAPRLRQNMWSFLSRLNHDNPPYQRIIEFIEEPAPDRRPEDLISVLRSVGALPSVPAHWHEPFRLERTPPAGQNDFFRELVSYEPHTPLPYPFSLVGGAYPWERALKGLQLLLLEESCRPPLETLLRKYLLCDGFNRDLARLGLYASLDPERAVTLASHFEDVLEKENRSSRQTLSFEGPSLLHRHLALNIPDFSEAAAVPGREEYPCTFSGRWALTVMEALLSRGEFLAFQLLHPHARVTLPTGRLIDASGAVTHWVSCAFHLCNAGDSRQLTHDLRKWLEAPMRIAREPFLIDPAKAEIHAALLDDAGVGVSQLAKALDKTAAVLRVSCHKPTDIFVTFFDASGNEIRGTWTSTIH